MSNAFSHSGVLFAISTTAENDDLTEAEFEALTYVNVAQVGSIGPYGIATNIISYDTLDRDVMLKAKGLTDAGSPEIEIARRDTDAGQIRMRLAGAVDNKSNYAFRVTKQDGAVDYLRGLCAGPNRPSGRNEDFDLEVYTLGLNQEPIHVNLSP